MAGVDGVTAVPAMRAPHTAGTTEREATDAALVHACRAGDQQAWDALVRRYERLVFSVALRNGASREDAADVTQNTFIALLESLDRLRDDERLSAWLLSVARRQSWRSSRLRKHEASLPPELSTDDPAGGWDAVADVHASLHQLGSPCRELLTALYFEADAPSYAEIATAMGRAIGSIGPLRARCLGKLRILMDHEL